MTNSSVSNPIFYKTRSLNRNVEHTFYRNFKELNAWKDSLVSCDLDIAPTRMQDPAIYRLCTITSDLRNLKKKVAFDRRWRRLRPYYSAKYDIFLGSRDSNLDFFLEHKGQRYGIAKVEFE